MAMGASLTATALLIYSRCLLSLLQIVPCSSYQDRDAACLIKYAPIIIAHPIARFCLGVYTFKQLIY